MVDDDPARAQLKSEALHASALAKAKREMANAKSPKGAARFDPELLPAAAWRNLAALEAGRLEVKSPEVMTEYVTMAANGTLPQSYPMLAWHLTNMERKYAHASDVRTQLTPLCEVMLLTAELAYSILRKISGKSFDVREESSNDGLLVRRHDRDGAIIYIEQWLQKNARDELIYCDSYFSTKDIQLLRICLAYAPQCKITIIASRSHLQKQNELAEEPFLRAWRSQCDQDPPETEVIAPAFVEFPNKHVLHDRWLLTENAGLRLGTSFNSLGMERLSEVSEIDPGMVTALLEQVEKYRSRQRFVDGAKLQYSTFTI